MKRRTDHWGTVVRILARRPDSPPARTSLRSVYVGLRPRSGSLRESHLSPHVSQSSVTRHSPRQNALPQAQAPRRQAIPALLPCDCRPLRATGGLCRRFASICDRQKTRRSPAIGEGSCVRSGRDGRAPSGERRADEVRRRSATRFEGKVAEGDREKTRQRPRAAHAPRRARGARSTRAARDKVQQSIRFRSCRFQYESFVSNVTTASR